MNSYTPGDNPYDFDLPGNTVRRVTLNIDASVARDHVINLCGCDHCKKVLDATYEGESGYIKVEVDATALREALTEFYPFGIPTIPTWPNTEIEGHVSFLIELGVEVLAALEGETRGE